VQTAVPHNHVLAGFHHASDDVSFLSNELIDGSNKFIACVCTVPVRQNLLEFESISGTTLDPGLLSPVLTLLESYAAEDLSYGDSSNMN